MAKIKGIKHALAFKLRNETPGTVRYSEVNVKGEEAKAGEGMVVGTLYVRKDQLGDTPPQSLKVTVEGA